MSRESDILRDHWLTGVGARADDSGIYASSRASCWCGWNGSKQPSVSYAVEEWAEHAAEMLSRSH